jgi:hypothetical protein
MYLIFEFEEVPVTTKNLSEEDFEMAELGYIFIIDITDPLNPKEYYDGQWSVVESR